MYIWTEKRIVMSTLILYTTTHGCTEKCVRFLMLRLNDEVTVVNLKNTPEQDLTLYDRVIIGGSIHMGGIQKELRKFCDQNQDMLLRKKLGLFLCCLFEGEVAQKQFEEAYPAALRAHATATGLFGGEITFGKMNALQKMVVKKVAKISQDVSKLDETAMNEFARAVSG